MLITNFASGELSENLFGRIDLPQYFQGVSRLENFDVVPTGGIIRRKGFRRLAELPGEGRIIPFIIDRETHILLFLSPGKISIIVDGVITKTVESSTDLPLYATMEEINEVQYAQNFDVMVLVHENYYPILISLDDDAVSIGKFEISTVVEIVASEKINKGDFFEKDSQYELSGYLVSMKNYPKSVLFLNGRIVFGGTRNNEQRLFFSKVGNIHSFSTYKKYVTETREYADVVGTINLNTNTITISEPYEASKFKNKITDYYIDSGYFPEGTKAAGMNGLKIYLSNDTTGVNFSDDIKQSVFEWMQQVNAADSSWRGNYEVINRESAWSGQEAYARYKIGKFLFSYDVGGNLIQKWADEVFTIEQGEVKKCIESVSYLYDYVLARLQRKEYLNGGQFQLFISAFYGYIQDKMQQTLLYDGNEYTFYGTPEQIYEQVLGNSGGTVEGLIQFYTIDYLVDKTVSPDDGFTFEIASDMSDAIKWIGQNKNMLVGTETAEWIIPGSVNAANIQSIINSRYGSDNVQGTSIGDAFCFIQTGKKAIVEYYIPQQDNNFRANNMAMMSKNMLHESPVFDFDFQSAPYTRIFISREDGIVACLLYERMTGTFAWGRITTAGHIRSIAVLPGDGQDETYFVVERSGAFFLERLDDRDNVYLDGFHKGAPGPGEIRSGEYSGFPYTSRIRSMPVLANDKMKNNVIKTLNIRFHDSYLPKVTALAGVNREIKTDTIAREEPYSGIIQISFPGQYDRDVFFEFVHDKPTRCHILAVHAEAN